jgi:citrate lyase gamma subunit
MWHTAYGGLVWWRGTARETALRVENRMVEGEQVRQTIQRLARQAGLKGVRTAWQKDAMGKGRLVVMLQTRCDAAVLRFLRACEGLRCEGVRPTLFRLGKVAVAEGDGAEGLRGLLVLEPAS